MRVLLHDFAGHPFQTQLSRELAQRGHTVRHQFLDDDQTPKGAMTRRAGDSPNLEFEGLRLRQRLNKTNYVQRLRQDFEYGRVALAAAQQFHPDVYISANMPLDPLNMLQRGLKRRGTHFVFWQQDFYSLALSKILPKKLPIVGNAIAVYYRNMERRIAHQADSIVCISDDFLAQLEAWGVDLDKCTTIENWAALDEIRPTATRPTAWQTEQGLADRRVVLYSGTLGLKHNPALLWCLAERLAAVPDTADVQVVVCSAGVGAEWLLERCCEQPHVPLTVLPFQPYERFNDVLGAATLVTALLEPNAGVFSVPSKVLSYMAAGQPILLAAPEVNLAARTVQREGAGTVVDPSDLDGFAEAALSLLREPEQLAVMGTRGRRYAEGAFDITKIADRFEHLWTPRLSAAA